jgi:hypothetical protein
MLQRVDASVLNVPSSITKEVIFGPKQVQALKVAFDSATNTGLNLNYQFAPKAVITNDWYLQYSLVMQVQAPAGALPAGAPLFGQWGKNVAPRNFPLLWAMNSTTLRINDQVFTCQLKDLMPYISKCLSNQDALEYSDTNPALPDQGFYNYADAVGTSKNVLGGYNDSRENWTGRGSWLYDAVGTALVNGIPNGTVPVAGADGSASGFVQWTCTTPLLIPPLANKAVGIPTISLSNLYNINITVAFDGQFNKVLSVPSGWTTSAPANVFTSATNGNVNLLMISSYPSDIQSIPPEVKLPNLIYEIKTQPISVAINNGAEGLINSAIYQYDSYPDAFVVFAHKRMSAQVASDADVFLKFKENFSITINGDNSLLNGYTDSQMYQLCKKYVRMDFNEFSGRVNAVINGSSQTVGTAGPVYVFRPAIDLPISQNAVAPNMAGYRIQMQFNNLIVQNFSGNNYANGDLELVVIALRSGEITLTPSSGMQTATILNQADVVSALTKEPLYVSEVAELEGEVRSGGKMRMTTAKSMRGSARSAGAPMAGARSGGAIPVATAVPKTHTSRF